MTGTPLQPQTNATTRRADIIYTNCDQEAWLKQNIQTAMRMAIELYKAMNTRSDSPTYKSGLDGIANGTAIEIVHSLGMELEYINIRKNN